MEHTQTPWEIRKTNNEGARIWNPALKGIGDIAHVYEKGKYPDWKPNQLKANAEFIVRAVNSHDDLVEACKLVINSVTLGRVASRGSDRVKSYEIPPIILNIIKHAIQKAEGK